MSKEQEKRERLERRTMIREFDRNWNAHTSNGMEPVYKLAKGAYLMFIGMMMAIPYEKDWSIMMSYAGLTCLAVWLFMLPKMFVPENRKNHSIYEKLKYTPIPKREIQNVRVGYLIRFLRMPFIVAIVAQLAGAWLMNHQIGVANIGYPFLMQGMLPLLFGIIIIVER